MRQAIHHLTVATTGKGLVDITRDVSRFVEATGIAAGLATIFCRHTSASLLIQENADPDVQIDLEAFFARIAPEGRGLYVHDTEGPDDMPAHIRTALDAEFHRRARRARQALARHLAGHLSLRASQRAASTRDRRAGHGGMSDAWRDEAGRSISARPI